jgi:hypothetical protein
MAFRRAAQVGDHTTAVRRHAAEFPDPCPTPSTSAILAGTGISGVIVIAVRVRVHGGAARVASESLLQDWLYRLYRQRLCGSVIPVFGLRGYVSELLFTITALLLDRSLGNSGLRRIIFLLFASNPNSGIRAGSMRSMLIQLEYIVLMQALIIRLLPSNVYSLISVA